MTSRLSWLNYSDEERRKILDVIDRFRDKDTRDELGLGSVRDAFADLLFPGTSTIQTRARYFLFIPWIYQETERQSSGRKDAGHRAWRLEVNLISALADSDDSRGTIGIDAREKLQRFPSSVYWSGLRAWGIRRFDGSREQYHRWIDMGLGQQLRPSRDDDDDPQDRSLAAWHRGLPEPPEEFPESVSMQLRTEDAEYLTERILASAPETLLALLVAQASPGEWVDFAWQHSQIDGFPSRIQEQLDHARLFSEVMHGAPLLYNLMVAELIKNEELVERYRLATVGWQEYVGARASDLSDWDLDRLWQIAEADGARIGEPTRAFVKRWLEQTGEEDVANSPAARQLVHDRERAVKGDNQARLINPRARRSYEGEAGTTQLDYRWGTAQLHLQDILSLRSDHSA